MYLYLGFGHSRFLPNGGDRRLQLLSVLQAEDVSDLIECGVKPRFDHRYVRLIRALRTRYGIYVPMPGAVGASFPHVKNTAFRLGDQVVVIWIEAPTRPFLVDPCEYEEWEIREAEICFTLEEVV